MTPLELVGSLGIVGYGLGAIGPGIGVGLIFASVIQGTARQPEARGAMMGTAWIGFAVTEALAAARAAGLEEWLSENIRAEFTRSDAATLDRVVVVLTNDSRGDTTDLAELVLRGRSEVY